MTKEKGITLVSLVVTIIVLIILAGVSINLILGQDGIITKAKEAKENTELAKIEDERALNELYMQIETEGVSSGSISYDAIAKLTEFKTAIANYIEEAGGVKPENTADFTTFGDSIKGIVKEVTKNATATAEDIANGKTAWVNGELIEGNNSGPSSIGAKYIGCYFYRVRIAGGAYMYNTIDNTSTFNTSNAECENFIIDTTNNKINILKSGIFDVIAIGNGVEQYKVNHQYIEKGTSYTFSGGNTPTTQIMIMINSY